VPARGDTTYDACESSQKPETPYIFRQSARPA
jgi:hypothetical protein